MKTSFLDTNIFIRYLTNDDPVKADRVEKLLRDAAEGKVLLVTTEMVIAEIVWVMESYYQLGNRDIAPKIHAILATPGLEVINGDLVNRALEYYVEANIDFIDGYIASIMEKKGISEIYSFDRKHLSKLTKLRRREP